MPSTITDRLNGLTTSVAVKPPCVAVASSNITQAGLQTIASVALVEGDRVLCIGQSSQSLNGIWLASTGDWVRAKDFDGARDAVQGTLVLVRNQFVEGAFYEVTTPNPITFGSSSIAFRLRDDPNITYDITQAEVTAAVTPVSYAFERTHIERQGAVAGLVVDSLAAVNKAILTNSSTIESYDGEFLVSAVPTNPFGKQFIGTGAILKADPLGGFEQLNTYADIQGRYVFGLEYRGRLFARLQNAAAVIKTFAYGDSTVATGGSSESAFFYTETLLPYMCRSIGLNRDMVLTNRGVSGTDISSMNAIPDLASDTDLFIIKYGINDGLVVGDRLNTFATTLRSKLAAIRAATFGGEALLTIVLVGPNSTNDSPQGRDERWYEQLRNVYIQAARDYKCVYIDIYGMFQDSRSAATIWMDDPFANGIGIHPNNIGRAWIWGAVTHALFGDMECVPYRANLFHNVSGTYEDALAAVGPSGYPFGLSIRRAKIANGFLEEGVVITFRHIDLPALQMLFPFAAGRTIVMNRVANSGADTWNLWTGEKVALSLQNGWVTFGGGYDNPNAVLSNDGLVTVYMIIKDGTTTAGTVLATLPAGMRPVATVGPYVCITSGGTCSVRVDSSGNIIVHSTADATSTAISFPFRAV